MKMYLLVLINFIGLFSGLSVQAACNPCVCGYGGENPWPRELVEFCRGDLPSPTTCISYKTARDILVVNITQRNQDLNPNDRLPLNDAIAALKFDHGRNEFISDFSFEGRRREIITITCEGRVE